MVSIFRGIHQCRPSFLVFGVFFCPRFEQEVNAHMVACVRGNHQGRPPVTGLGVLLRPGFEQKINALMVPIGRGIHQSCQAHLVSGIILVCEEEGLRDAFGMSAADELCLQVSRNVCGCA